MNAGRELDVLIAEKVMGCTLRRFGDFYPHAAAAYQDTMTCGCEGQQHRDQTQGERNDDCLAPYSTDIAAAWLVVEKVLADRVATVEVVKIVGGVMRHIGGKYSACFSEQIGGGLFAMSDECTTAPHAICLAALKAVGYTVPE